MADLIARARRRGPRAEASAVPDAVVGMQSPAHGGNPVAKRTARQRLRRRRCVHQEPDGSPRAAGPRRRASGRAAKATAAAVPHAYIRPQSRSYGGAPPRGANALWRPLTVGLVHGLAGSGALTAIAFAELPGCRSAAPVHDPSRGSARVDCRDGARIGRRRGRAARHPAVGRRAPRPGSGPRRPLDHRRCDVVDPDGSRRCGAMQGRPDQPAIRLASTRACTVLHPVIPDSGPLDSPARVSPRTRRPRSKRVIRQGPPRASPPGMASARRVLHREPCSVSTSSVSSSGKAEWARSMPLAIARAVPS